MVAGKGNVLGLAIALAGGAALLAGCGGGDDEAAASGSLPAKTAEELAGMSDGIGDALEAGDTCEAAHQADELKSAVSEADIPEDLRAEVEAGADQLVNQVNCDDQEEEGEDEKTTTEEREHGKEDEESSEEESLDEGSGEKETESGGGPPGQSDDFVPPGQQGKIKGGI